MGGLEDVAGDGRGSTAGDPDGQVWMGLGELGGEGFAIVATAEGENGLGVGALQVGSAQAKRHQQAEAEENQDCHASKMARPHSSIVEFFMTRKSLPLNFI